MIRKEMSLPEFREMLVVRLREVRKAPLERQDRAVRAAWEMVRSDVPWNVVLAAARALCAPHPDVAFPNDNENNPQDAGYDVTIASEVRRPRLIDPVDLARAPAPPLRPEVGRYEREKLSTSTRQAIRLARQARRWHEIRKMRNILLNIDQAHLKRTLGADSEALNQEINSLLRSWAPLIHERQQGGRMTRRRR